jgi:hypothetical protein
VNHDSRDAFAFTYLIPHRSGTEFSMIAFPTEMKAPQTFTPGQLQLAVAYGGERPDPPTHRQIAQRAFDIYVADGRQPGQCRANWYRAERQLIHESQAAPKPAACFRYL